MKQWILLWVLVLGACSEPAPKIPQVDVAALEGPVANAVQQSIEDLELALDEPRLWSNYAEVLQAHQLYGAARKAWQARFKLGSLQPGELLLMLRCEEALGQPIEGVQEAVSSLLVENSDLISLRFSRGSSRLRAGDLQGAKEDLELALGQDRHPAILLAFGRTVLSLGDAERARALLEEARAGAPGDVDIQKTLAPVYLQLGESDLANTELQRQLRGPKALRFDPAEIRMTQRSVSSSANTDRAREAMSRREWRIALVWLNKILAVYPDRASAHARRGMCHLMTNQPQEAERDFRKAIGEDESLAMAHRGLGVLAGRSGRTAQAVTHLARALELNPDDPDAVGMYPIALLKAGQLQEAESAYLSARKRFPNNRILVQQWLVVLRRMGRPDQGFAAATSAIQELGEDAALLHHAGLCLEAMGRTKEARQYHERSVAADEKSPSAARLEKIK